jgi:calcium-dependent protein kinase
MGEICSKPVPITLASCPIDSQLDLIVSPDIFVKENTGNIYKYYRLSENTLGSGGWGQVRKCVHKITKEERVVKIICKAELPQSLIDSREAFKEAEILKKLDHPNLPRIYEFFEDTSNYYIILEYCKGGDLFDRITEMNIFTEQQASEIIKQILLAVNYLHNKGIVHRDIKPENILMTDPNTLSLKLIDFDTAAFFSNTRLKNIFGTALYMAPEVIKLKYNEKCDLWSCGIILYILLKGRPPYDGTDERIYKILNKVKIDLTQESWNSISPQALDLLSKLLEVNPSKRISAAEACAHPWVNKVEKTVTDSEILNVLQDIINFRKTSKLKEAIHTFIITKIADPSIYRTEDAIFHILDLNRDGTISNEEFIKIMVDYKIPLEEAKMNAELIMEKLDSDRSGFIDYSEFLRGATKDKLLTKENILNAFKMLDQDQNGSIEMDELQKWLSGDRAVNNEIIEEIISQVDKNGDGKIDLFEFESLLLEKINSRESRSIELLEAHITQT